MNENYFGHGEKSFEEKMKSPGLSKEKQTMQQANHPGTTQERNLMDKMNNPAHYTGQQEKKKNW